MKTFPVVGQVAVLVVGSGIAGLSCALEADARGLGPILVASKRELDDSNTHEAQGGIAGALPETDSPALHARDTLVAGAGGCDGRAVRRLCGEGKSALEWLIAQGVPFDRVDGHWAFGLEAAHAVPRILHAQGDGTGRAIAETLIARTLASRVRTLAHAMLVDLVVEYGRVIGADFVVEGQPQRWLAEAVVLATGGAGQVYARTCNPAVATGDGVATAFRAGAAIRDAEFFQFHPTVLALPDDAFLISEAVRGEGAVLRDVHGERFMPALDPRAELAPRDVVARGIAAVMARQNGQPVWLDATAIGPRIAARFPGISRRLAAHGLALDRNRIPVTPAAHYWMGGIATDTWGRSSLPGLYAVGEAACTGVHGANRLASNSLLEGAVFGRRAARRLAGDASQPAWPRFASEPLPAVVPEREDVPAFTRQALRVLMWQQVGLQRDARQLECAAARLRAWQPQADAAAASLDPLALETRNLLEVARLICQFALRRQESRGAHCRLDYPQARARAPHLPAMVRPAAAPARIGAESAPSRQLEPA